MLLRLAVSRHFRMDNIMTDLAEHMQWRQVNMPLPLINDKVINLLKHGVLYIHGRTKDLSPIIVLDIKELSGLIARNEIDAAGFCCLHNFLAHYVMHNMLVPGQQEKWIVICNLN